MGRISYKFGVDCEECVRIAEMTQGIKGEPVINRGDLCVDLSRRGEENNRAKLSPMLPELQGMPKKVLCPKHRRDLRRVGGEWVTVTEAAAMQARQAKRDNPNNACEKPAADSMTARLTRVMGLSTEGLDYGGEEESQPPILRNLMRMYGGRGKQS